MHPYGGRLYDELDFSRQIQQLIQTMQGKVCAKAGSKDTQVLHIGIQDPQVFRSGNHRVFTVAQRQGQAVAAMTGQIKPHGDGAEHIHFLSNANLDGVVAAAAESVDPQNDPLDFSVVRIGQNAGNIQFTCSDRKLFLHRYHPTMK